MYCKLLILLSAVIITSLNESKSDTTTPAKKKGVFVIPGSAIPGIPPHDFFVKFAPKWMFMNSGGNGYPMNPQRFYEFITRSDATGHTGDYYEWSKENGNVYIENNDFDAIYDGTVPTLYAVDFCHPSGRIHILYYIAYGFQHSCSACFGGGAHQGGFELVTVVLTKAANDVFGVYFKQHSGHYFRQKNECTFSDNHVKVYVGKYAHGTYHYAQGNSASISSLYWDDPRNGDKQWIPEKDELLDITNIDTYSFNNNNEPPFWNGRQMSWMKVSSASEFPSSAHADKQKYGQEFFGKIGKLIDNVCDIDPCKGQSRLPCEGCAQGCEQSTCFDSTKYTDYTQSRPWRCKEGCGNHWKAFGDECCKTKLGMPYKCKDRVDYARNNQPFEI